MMTKVIKQNNFRKNSELKWETARMLIDFEISYLSQEGIHSPTILGLSSTFNHWNIDEINKHKKDIAKKLQTYLEMYSKIQSSTSEEEIVKDELKKTAVKFGLL